MKKVIDVMVKALRADVLSVRADLLAVGFFEGEKPSGRKQQLDRRLKGAITSALKLKDFIGKDGSTAMFYGDGRIGSRRVLLVGLGDRKKASLYGLRKAASTAASLAVDLKAPSLVVWLYDGTFGKDLTLDEIGCALAEGIYFGAYRYDEYMSDDKSSKRPDRITASVFNPFRAGTDKLAKGMRIGSILGKAQSFARTIANRPANVMTPAAIAAEAKKLARGASLQCTVLDEKQLAEQKMGGILAVGKGSVNKPRLIILKYTQSGKSSSRAALALVGKGITFDSGGISIKPCEGMQDMKFDKSGGIAVLGAMQAIAALKPKRTVYGLIPSAENMPGGASYRPGDIVTTYSGKTVEIQNTDAEGRMLLCDAIAYADKILGCSPIVDIATLTGACVVAVGTKRAGLMGNDEKLVGALQEASKQTSERVWHLPCDDEFVEAMKSKIADLKNTGGKWGGACTAAAYLSQFAGKAKWAHVDMAGVGVWGAGEKDAPGSIGFGVRLLSRFVLNWKS